MGERFVANLSIFLRALRFLLYVMAIGALICAVGFAPWYLPERPAAYVYAVACRLNLYVLLDWLYPALIGGGATVLVMVPVMAYVRARMIWKKFAGFKSHYILSGEGVQVKSAMGNADLNWEMFSLARENRRFFFLYSIPGLANLIPKRVFATTAEVEGFRSLLRAHVKKVSLRKD